MSFKKIIESIDRNHSDRPWAAIPQHKPDTDSRRCTRPRHTQRTHAAHHSVLSRQDTRHTHDPYSRCACRQTRCSECSSLLPKRYLVRCPCRSPSTADRRNCIDQRRYRSPYAAGSALRRPHTEHTASRPGYTKTCPFATDSSRKQSAPHSADSLDHSEYTDRQSPTHTHRRRQSMTDILCDS